MHLELTEIFVCPDCGPGHGLIAFVDRMEERRIVEGRLDCPMCERRHEIRGGVVLLVPEPAAGPPAEAPDSPSPTGATDDGEPPDDAATMAAALLGPPGGPEVLLLASGTSALGPAIADLRPDAALVTFGDLRSGASAGGASHARVNRVVVPADSGAAGLPIRAGVLDGAVLPGTSGASFLADAVRALSPGSRLVVLSPSPEATATLSELEEVEQLATDPRAWVGARL